jgi:putative Mn2+ efflux pump MntP
MIAIGLAMDAFAVSLAAATSGVTKNSRAIFRLSFHFGLFQFLMPVVGWYMGSKLVSAISAYDHWIAFALLAIIGIRMIRPDRSTHEGARTDPSRGWNLVLLSVATSIDALAVGFSLAMIEVAIWAPSILIGVVTASLSLVGIFIGDKLGKRFGRRMEIVGGLLLVLIGVKILYSHIVLGVGSNGPGM